jgi:Tfp pilus assembly protein PilN
VSQVNLLPPELRQRQTIRRRTGMVVAAGLVVLAVIGGFYYLQMTNLSHAKDDLAAQESINSGIQTKIGGLTQYADLQAQLLARKALVATVFANEVSWSSALIDVSQIIPANSYLSSLTGSLVAATGAAPGTAPPTTGGVALIGAMSFSGLAKEADTVASWLTRLEQVKGWANPWATTFQENGPFSRIYSFDSGIDLTTEAETPRGRGETGSGT